MSKQTVQLTDRDHLLVKTAVLTYGKFMKGIRFVGRKKRFGRFEDFTLGELAAKIKKTVGTSDECVKELVEVLRKNKDEVVAFI